MTILVESDVNYCLYLEEKLRPSKNIGWNIEKGGGLPPKSQKGRKCINRKSRKGIPSGLIPWNKGLKLGPIPEEIKIIRYANLIGNPTSKKQKENANKALKNIPKEKVECPFCNMIGGKPQMIQWHFDNCKFKEKDD